MKGKKGFSKGEQNPSSIYFKGRNVEKNIVVKCTRTYTPRRRSSILEQLDQGRSKTNVAGNHGINIRTVQRIASTNQNSPQQRGPKLKIVPNSEVEDVLFDIADHEPFARITEINEKFSLETGVVISNETIKRVLYRRNGGEFVFVSPDKSKLEEAGINVVMLSPKGHLLNPSELFNNCIQQKVVRWRPPGDPTDEYGHAIVGPRSFDECAMAVNDALDEMKDKPEMFHEFFNKRATGRDFLNRVAKSSVAKNVKARRSRAGIANRQIFSWPARRN